MKRLINRQFKIDEKYFSICIEIRKIRVREIEFEIETFLTINGKKFGFNYRNFKFANGLPNNQSIPCGTGSYFDPKRFIKDIDEMLKEKQGNYKIGSSILRSTSEHFVMEALEYLAMIFMSKNKNKRKNYEQR